MVSLFTKLVFREKKEKQEKKEKEKKKRKQYKTLNHPLQRNEKDTLYVDVVVGGSFHLVILEHPSREYCLDPVSGIF